MHLWPVGCEGPKSHQASYGPAHQELPAKPDRPLVGAQCVSPTIIETKVLCTSCAMPAD